MNAKKILNESSHKEITSLFKTMLMLVEDMMKDHMFHYQKLYEEIPKKYHAAEIIGLRKLIALRLYL